MFYLRNKQTLIIANIYVHADDYKYMSRTVIFLTVSRLEFYLVLQNHF